MPTAPVAPSPDGVALVTRLEPLRPMPLRDVQRAMTEYQEGLQALLADADWQTFRDRDGRERRFVKRTGWRKIGTWFGVDLLIGSVDVERDDLEHPLRARVVGRAVAPNGRVAEDVGACALDEGRRFAKPEHDLVATAATRALNRATSNLVGMGEVTAEEALGEVEPMLPEWALPAPPARVELLRTRLVELVGERRADVLLPAVEQRYDGVPNVVVGIVNALHSMLTGTPPVDLSTSHDDAARDAAQTSGGQ